MPPRRVPAQANMDSEPCCLVLDTNIVLDLIVFRDPACQALKQALERGQVRWIATQEMRDELARVLAYPKILPRLATYQLTAVDVLLQFDRLIKRAAAAPRALLRCRDADDQKFVDLALAHGASLLSKDRAVLAMKKRLGTMGVRVQTLYLDTHPAGVVD